MKIQVVAPGDRQRWHALLLIGDEDPAMLARYEAHGTLWGGVDDAGQPVAVALVCRTGDGLELKNLAVAPDQQGRGLGSELVQYMITAYRGQASALLVGTGDAEDANLRFYQRNGFVCCGLRRDFFSQYTPVPRVNGRPLRDMVLLTHSLG
ncbi:GNAT family N-acetyltransferase [Lacticaseibacillus absianus]|uniref:GNAT family N-acetyltransferase n=1 Tax=Lacticaseibacillus absianus TaxID=2729623 RepID=UPI0015CB7E42|nr:GNAT family N-acetyltransferase [Lacticaseibacillus absianus]